MVKKLLLILLCFVAAGSLAANVLLYNRYSAKRPLVRVGDEAITRKDYQDTVDFKSDYGKTTLKKLVFAKVIKQAATKAGVMPSDKDIDVRLAELKKINPRGVELASADPAHLADLRQNVAADLAFENLRMRDIKVSDSEIQSFYNKNKAAFTTPTQTSGMVVLAKNRVDAATAAEMMRQRIAPDVIAQQPRLGVVGVRGFNPDLGALPKEVTARIRQAVFTARIGSVTTVPFLLDKQEMFLIYRADKKAAPTLQTFAEVKPKIERALKLQKAPTQQVALVNLYKSADVTFEAEAYKPFFSDMEVAQVQTAAR